MDQVKIGAFISEQRRSKGLTQKELADMLYISDKAVSKWERGRGVPDISLMLPLCEALDISVAELLRGERVIDADERTREEQTILANMEKRANEKRTIILCSITIIIALLGLSIIAIVGNLDIAPWEMITLIVIAAFIIVGDLIVAAFLDYDCGVYECRACKTRFKPTIGAYLIGAHTLTARWLKCPKCAKSTMCRRRFTK